MRQVPLLLRSLLGQNVTFKGVLSLDLSTSREFETLLGASFGFHLRHGLGFYDWLFFLRIEKNGHSLSLEPWQLFNCSVLFEFLGKLQKQDFTSLLEDDGPSSEEYISFELRAFFQKLLGVFQLKIEIMVIRVRSESNFLDNDLLLLGLHLLLLLLLVVEEFLVLDDSANGWIGFG